MKRMTNYYACALKENSLNMTAMQRKVLATLLPIYSSNEEPCHLVCLKGEESWFHHNCCLALQMAGKPLDVKPHRPTFLEEVAEALVPLYNPLMQKDLLDRCTWKRCLKMEFVSLQTTETGVALEYSMGP